MGDVAPQDDRGGSGVWVDRTDAVAEALTRPCRYLAIAMVFRGGSHFPRARQRGDAADPVACWAAKAKELAISTRHPARAAPAPVPT